MRCKLPMHRKIVVFVSALSWLCVSHVPSVSAQDYLVDLEPTPVSYQLPYPGLLPTNSFYFLKVTRDNVFGFFLSDPLKKTEFYLLQSDKRIEASYVLSEQKPYEFVLVTQTFDESLSYFSDALLHLTDAHKQGIDIRAVQQRMLLSNLKHQERAKEIVTQLRDEDAQKFSLKAKELVDLEKRIRSLLPEKEE